ncbi:MAG: FGGY-family carbohydrate kinase, partial [Actinobacteria bacterium]|nr:FGGY-family carbohydrate kinase [Actinomycetota bacterium]
WTGLPVGIAVATGNVDAHVTSPAARAIEPGQMLAVMGTSTCHVMNGETLAEVPGMCGVVADGITAGSWAYEAGQSGVGDIFAWFVDTAVPGRVFEEAAARGLGIHEHLSDLASQLQPGEHGLAVLDWISGNRSVLVNHELSGLVLGITMATQPHEIYRALLEATAYGTRVIVEAFDASGVPVRELVCAGGLVKNGVLMQLYADIVGLPLSILDSEQGPALGSAIHAAVAAGAYPDVRAASERMGRIRRAAYVPDPTHREVYDELYREYLTLHDYFGRGVNDVMLNLKALRREVLAR